MRRVSGSRPLTHRAVRRGCSVVSHSIVFEYVRLVTDGSDPAAHPSVRASQALLASALPPCAVVGATAPLVFYCTAFCSEKRLKNHETCKNAGFSLPRSRRDDLHAVGDMLNRKAVVRREGSDPSAHPPHMWNTAHRPSAASCTPVFPGCQDSLQSACMSSPSDCTKPRDCLGCGLSVIRPPKLC